MTVSAKDVRHHQDQIFDHTGAILLPATFANRDEPIDRLKHLLSQGSGVKAVVLSEVFGSGKTTLINHACGLGIFSGEVFQTNPRRLHSSGMRPPPRNRLVVVDDIDIKSPYDQVRAALEWSARLSGVPLLLSGDLTLRNRSLMGAFLAPDKAVYLDIPPMTPSLLGEVLEKRVIRYLCESVGIELLASEVREMLFPRSEYPIFTLRDALSILYDSTTFLPHEDIPCVFTREEVVRAIELRPLALPTPEMRTFADGLIHWVRSYLYRDQTIPKLTLATLAEIAGTHLRSTTGSFEDEVVAPIAQSSLLLSLGVPFEGGQSRLDEVPGPYIPGPEAILRAYGGGSG